MATQWRHLRLTLYFIVALALAGYLYVRHKVNTPAFKHALQAQLSKSSGLPVQLQGPIKLNGFPRTRLTIQSITFGNPTAKPQPNAPYFAKLNKVVVIPSLRSLLQHTMRVNKLTIPKATFYIASNEQQQYNTPPIIASAIGALVDHETESPLKRKLNALHPLSIEHANVYWVAYNQPKRRFSPLQLSITPQSAHQITLQLNTKLHNGATLTPTPISVLTHFSLKPRGLFIQSAQCHFGALHASFLTSAKEHHQATLTVAPFNARQWLQQLNGTPTSSTREKNTQAQMILHYSPDSFSVSPLNFTWAGNAITGSLQYQNQTRPTWSIKLNTKTFNIRSLQPLSLITNALHLRSTSLSSLFSRIPSKLELKGQIRVQTALFNDLTAHDVTAQLKFQDNQLIISPLKFSFEQGQVESSTLMINQGDSVKIINQLSLNSIPLQPLTRPWLNNNAPHGDISLYSDTQLNGDRLLNLLSSLHSHGQFAIHNGAVKGIDLLYQLRKQSHVTRSQQSYLDHLETEFHQLKGDFSLNQNTLSSQKLELTLDGERLFFHGTTNLHTGALQYQMGDTHASTNLFTLSGTALMPELRLNKKALQEGFSHPHTVQRAPVNKNSGFLSHLKGLL